MTSSTDHPASARLVERLKTEKTFQISVDTGRLALGLSVAEAAVKAGVTIIEMGTPLLKCEGVLNVVPAFRKRFPDAVLLADMKTMDGGAFEARSVYEGGGNIIDFLALAGAASARNVCAVRDEFRAADPGMARLAFADILLPHQGPADVAIETGKRMLDAGVDGIGIHLQLDARREKPKLLQSGYIIDIAGSVHAEFGDRASVQVVGGLSVAQALELAGKGLRAFVISGNLGVADAEARFGLPAAEIEKLIGAFIAALKGQAD